MQYQLEITTRCNFDCFYCAGRDMPQKDMSWETFTKIMLSIPGKGYSVWLQGEGEPSLHPQFEAMARYVRQQGHNPYTILNGSRVNIKSLPALFPTIGFSIDTLEDQSAHQTGRYNLPKVLKNIELLTQAMQPKRINIMTVDMGQPLDDLRQWVRARGFGRHIVQALSPKSDYARRYTVNSQAIMPTRPSTCAFLTRNIMRFYTWEGKDLPCCFIKNPSDFKTIPVLQTQLAKGEISACCAGCTNLKKIN
jgi:MoaA/NifB/PqqE/SkfB family radical SAM enzyme